MSYYRVEDIHSILGNLLKNFCYLCSVKILKFLSEKLKISQEVLPEFSAKQKSHCLVE